MAFTLEVIRGATTYNISNGAPFSIDGADGLGGASVRNIEESGPYQDGATHLDERLEPRTGTLRINVLGASAATLDGYRDTLMKIFKPVRGVPITLKLTRDDGVIRHLDTRRAGPLDIPLVKENRPGNLHRAVVQLRAADPAWYDPTEQDQTFAQPLGDWWLAYATIGSASVLTHVESPTQGQLWDNAGSVAAGSAYTIAFRSGLGTPTLNPWPHALQARDPSTGFLTDFLALAENPPTQQYAFSGGTVGDFGDIMTAGTHNYFMVSSGTSLVMYRDGAALISALGATSGLPGSASAVARWRSDYTGTATSYWPPALPYAAVYNVALDSTQRASLNDALDIVATAGSAYSAPVVYVGDIDSYPIITISGYMADPVITNQTTGDTLDFTGGTVGSLETWVIDLRYGRKSVLLNTTSMEQYLSIDSDLTTFRLVPDPIATGGTNLITVATTNAGTAASVVLAYYNRYLSY